jgi:hypothetical protein
VRLSLQNTAKIMSSSMAAYLAHNPENTLILSAKNERNLHNFILCMCAKRRPSHADSLADIEKTICWRRSQAYWSGSRDLQLADTEGYRRQKFG